MKEISFRDDILPLKDKLYRLALRITLDTAEAQDVVQDTLIRVWNKREEWQKLNSVEAYSMTACRNLALDRSAKAAHLNLQLDEDRDETPTQQTPYEELATRQQLEIVQKLMDRLPETQRSIMLLRDVEGKSYNEIAAILDLSEDQVKVYLYRARQRIKVQFSKIETYDARR